MQNEDFITQTQIGKHFKGSHGEHATSHEAGDWLEDAGFRDEDGKPTYQAVLSGLVTKRPSRGNRDYPVTVWHPDIIKILEEEGHERIE